MITGVERQGPCIVCRGSDGGFRSVEHVVPESMGNTELILPRGVVCDRCNSGQLAGLDQDLCDFPAIKMLRVIKAVPAKSGRHPRFRFTTGAMQQAESGLQIHINQHDHGRTLIDERRDDGSGTLHTEMTGGPRMTPRVIGRLRAGLLKMALESVWLDHGEFVMDSGFDHVRRAVCGSPSAGFVLIQSKMGEPTTQSKITYLLGEAGPTQRMQVAFDYFGWTCLTDSRRLKPAQIPPGYIRLGFDLSR